MNRRHTLSTLVCFFALLGISQAQAPSSLPILFAHGFCGSAFDFQQLIGPLYQQLPPNLYPSSTVYYVFYDSTKQTTTFLLDSDGVLVPVDPSSIPSSTRFFSIMFYDPVSHSADPSDVAKISILNKAYELSQVIKQIIAITKTKAVIVVAHSMGGLDARAYVENFASPGPCYSYGATVPDYTLPTCAPGSGDGAYANDVGDIISVDTPHPGDPLAELASTFVYLGKLLGQCYSEPSVNQDELNFSSSGGPGLVESLNFNGLPIAGVLPSENQVSIQAVQDYFSDVTSPWDNFGGWLTGYSDDIVLIQEQSILLNLPAHDTKASLADVPVGYLSSDPGINSTAACFAPQPYCLLLSPSATCPVLHYMTCLAAQPNTQNAIAAQVNAYLTNVISTLPATSITSSSAALNGSVNPEGSSGVAFFLWGTTPHLTLGSAKTSYVPVAVNFTEQNFAATLSDLASGTIYYYQMAFRDGSNVTYQYGPVLSFTTLAPVVVTQPATSITSSSAGLNGSVNPEGSSGVAFFLWGTTPNLTLGSAKTSYVPVVVNFTAQNFAATLSGLASGTIYYYQMAFRDGNNVTYQYGPVLSFTTFE